jgi:hypothetical protein
MLSVVLLSAKCHFSFVVMLSFFMVSVVKLNVVILCVVVPSGPHYQGRLLDLSANIRQRYN